MTPSSNNPENLTPEQYGAPLYRLLTDEERLECPTGAQLKQDDMPGYTGVWIDSACAEEHVSVLEWKTYRILA